MAVSRRRSRAVRFREAPGRLTLLAGGRGTERRAMERSLAAALSAGAAHPRVAYLGAANGDDSGFFERVAAWLRSAGAADVVHVKTADLHAFDLLASVDLVFVSGGDVEEGMSRLLACDWVSFLRELHGCGMPFCGLSAGSIMLAKEWVRWRDADDEDSAERFDCLALAGVRVDTHGEADAWQELLSLLRLCGAGTRGYGLRSGAAVEVDVSGTLRVVAGGVDVYENRVGRIVPLDVFTREGADLP